MTTYLLDTHILYRWLRDDRRLARRSRAILASADCVVSVASIWEMLIKSARGKLPLPKGSVTESIEQQGFRIVAITGRHVEESRRFNHVIRDPFDCLLIATASVEGMKLLTQDALILDVAASVDLPVMTAA